MAATRLSLEGAHPLIESRFAEYTNALLKRHIQRIATITVDANVKRSLKSLYYSSTLELEKLKMAIKAQQPIRLMKYCPMCETTMPGTFDHFLPSEAFPEFSIHPLNLVPCCFSCNGKKGDDWHATGKATFVNAYADLVPDIDFIKATLHVNPIIGGVGATFSLDLKRVPKRFRVVLKSHFHRLDLLARYQDMGNAEIAEIIADCKAFLRAAGLNARNFLLEQAADVAIHHGTSNWRFALMMALAAHPDFDAWIQ